MSIRISSNANIIGADLGKQSAAITRRMIPVLREAGDDLADEWRANARESSGNYSKHYQRAIQSKVTGPLEVTVAPWSGKQSDMSFEFGSINQPPHLDGQRAMDSLHKLIERRIAATLVF